MLITITDYANQFGCYYSKHKKKYELFIANTDELIPVNIAPADKPFEIVASYDNGLAAIRMGEKLTLVDPVTGKIPDNVYISSLGIIYDTKSSKFDVPNNIVNGNSGQHLVQAIMSVLFGASKTQELTLSIPVLQGMPIRQITRKRQAPKTKRAKKTTRTRKKSALSAEITAPYNIQKKHNVKYRAQSATKRTQRVVASKSQELAITISKEKRTYKK